MNDPYLKLNAEFLAQEDYLSMLRPPTYSNWQPSNDEGYTSMKPSLTDAKEAMELSPMLDQGNFILILKYCAIFFYMMVKIR